MKIATANKQGQVVIPINLRKRFKINEKTYLQIYVQDEQICIKPLEKVQDKKEENCLVDFPKDEQQADFHFQSKNAEEDNLAEKVDEILY